MELPSEKELIADHWDLLETDDEIDAAGAIRARLTQDLSVEQRIYRPFEDPILDGQSAAVWEAIAQGLGALGYELNSPEETRSWIEDYLL